MSLLSRSSRIGLLSVTVALLLTCTGTPSSR